MISDASSQRRLRGIERRKPASVGFVLALLVGLAACNGPLVSSSPQTATAGAPVNWKVIAAGAGHVLGIKVDGTLWAWGDNTLNELGDLTGQNHPQPNQMDASTNWAMVAGGNQFSLGLKTDGTLWAWGVGTQGQIGDGTGASSPGPVHVTPGTFYKAVAAGSVHVLAIKSDDTLWAWGGNASGQIGDGTLVQRNAPVPVDAPNTYSFISGGNAHSLAIRKGTGALYAWGDRTAYQLGDGTNAPSNQTTPLAVDVAQTYSSVSAGQQFSLGIRGALGSPGTVWGWGFNTVGSIGDNTIVTRPNPTQEFTGAANWIQIIAGSGESLGLRFDGTVWGWGINLFGAVGDGSTIERNAPTQEATASTTWIAIAAGLNGSSYGLRSDGTLWAWGSNSTGQIGDGTLTDKHVPTQIH